MAFGVAEPAEKAKPPTTEEWQEVAEEMFELLDLQDREIYEAEVVVKYRSLVERDREG